MSGRAVRRNIERFPADFMFELTKKELENWRCQFGTSNSDKMGLRHGTEGRGQTTGGRVEMSGRIETFGI